MNYVYRFKDKTNTIIYIGRTNNLRTRMSRHFTKTCHLPASCYSELNKIEYIEVQNDNDCTIIELYLIALHHPKHNAKSSSSNTELSINLDRFKWKEFKQDEKGRVTLVHARKEKGYTQQTLADKIGIARSGYTFAELGERDLPEAVWSQLSRLLNTPVNSLKEIT